MEPSTLWQPEQLQRCHVSFGEEGSQREKEAKNANIKIERFLTI
jgi:hypothetical protein